MPRDPKVIDLGPSASGRWSICTASPAFIVEHADQIPKDSSTYADEGTVAHAIAAKILNNEDPGPVEPEMMAHIRKYTDVVQANLDPANGAPLVAVEQSLNLFYLPHRGGTVDAAILRPDKVMIFDLKYGQGVSVEAEGNTQMAIYAESLIQSWSQIMTFNDDLTVEMTIVQPRDRNNPEAVRTWKLTRAELSKVSADLQAKAELALSSKGEFVPHEKACQFCPARGFCSAYATQGLTALPPEARVIELPHPGALTREQRVQVLKAKKILAKWLEAVEDQEVNDLMRGAEPVGMKLVMGKTNRVWRDEEAAQKLLSQYLGMNEMRPRSPLISPAAAERALKGQPLSVRFNNRMESLITKPEGKPTLVTADDPRPALSFDPNNGLNKLD